MVLQMVSPDKKKKNREKRKKKSKKYRAELEKTKEGRAILNKTKLYTLTQKEKKAASDKKNAAKKKIRSIAQIAAAKKRLNQRKKKAQDIKNNKIAKMKYKPLSKERRKTIHLRIDGPLGVFDDEGNLISGKSPSLENQQKFSTIPKSGQIKLTSDRVPRKCSGIHPHCSICDKCHRNIRTHWIGH